MLSSGNPLVRMEDMIIGRDMSLPIIYSIVNF